MITEIVTFELPKGMTREQLIENYRWRRKAVAA